jgi:hypothetical protein
MFYSMDGRERLTQNYPLHFRFLLYVLFYRCRSTN